MPVVANLPAMSGTVTCAVTTWIRLRSASGSASSVVARRRPPPPPSSCTSTAPGARCWTTCASSCASSARLRGEAGSCRPVASATSSPTREPLGAGGARRRGRGRVVVDAAPRRGRRRAAARTRGASPASSGRPGARDRGGGARVLRRLARRRGSGHGRERPAGDGACGAPPPRRRLGLALGGVARRRRARRGARVGPVAARARARRSPLRPPSGVRQQPPGGELRAAAASGTRRAVVGANPSTPRSSPFSGLTRSASPRDAYTRSPPSSVRPAEHRVEPRLGLAEVGRGERLARRVERVAALEQRARARRRARPAARPAYSSEATETQRAGRRSSPRNPCPVGAAPRAEGRRRRPRARARRGRPCQPSSVGGRRSGAARRRPSRCHPRCRRRRRGRRRAADPVDEAEEVRGVQVLDPDEVDEPQRLGVRRVAPLPTRAARATGGSAAFAGPSICLAQASGR